MTDSAVLRVANRSSRGDASVPAHSVGSDPHFTQAQLATVGSMAGLSQLLRRLRRRDARRRRGAELTYRAVASRTGWSHAVIGEYFSGRTLPPTDRFDVLVRLLGASEDEQGRLAEVRDRIADLRYARCDI